VNSAVEGMSHLQSLGNKTGILLAWGVMQILHRRLNIRVTHPLLDAAGVGLGDHPRAERVEVELAESCTRQRRLVAPTQRRAIEIAAGPAGIAGKSVFCRGSVTSS
jgi:hypothetical protein